LFCSFTPAPVATESAARAQKKSGEWWVASGDVTWPKNLSNYPYIEFWHRFDLAIGAENIAGMGPELLGDDAWTALFSSGRLAENTDIIMRPWICPQPHYDIGIFSKVARRKQCVPGVITQQLRPHPGNILGSNGNVETMPEFNIRIV